MDSPELDRLFGIAIARELEANSFYTSAAEKVENPAIRDMFKKLAKDEMGHYEQIKAFRADPTASMKIPVPSRDSKPAEQEELPKVSTDMKPKDALVLAMRKEQQAAEFYGHLADGTTDAVVKRIFLNLKNMELDHKERLETAFADGGYPEAF